MKDKSNFKNKRNIILPLMLLISVHSFLGYYITANYNNKNNSYCSDSINDIYLSDPPEIGVKEGDKFIYELVEKEDAIKEYLPELHALINATYWMVTLNYTQKMDDVDISGYGTITPIDEYFDTEYIQYTVLWHTYTIRISEILEEQGYPGIEGIAEWNYYENGGGSINFGSTAINKLLDGTTYGGLTLPGLVGDAQSGEGVLEFLELYDKALTDSDLRTQMSNGYTTTWAKLGVLVDYYNEYFVPEAIPELGPYAEEYAASKLEYVDVLDNFFEGDEVKGDYACSEIMNIEENQGGWNIIIDKWDFTSNIEDFNNTPADNTQTLNIYENAQNLGIDITVASICLQKQDVIPIIVKNYLNNILWNDQVKIEGKTLPIGMIYRKEFLELLNNRK